MGGAQRLTPCRTRKAGKIIIRWLAAAVHFMTPASTNAANSITVYRYEEF